MFRRQQFGKEIEWLHGTIDTKDYRKDTVPNEKKQPTICISIMVYGKIAKVSDSHMYD